MATELKKADVVIIGLGAVGGVAALPLTQAGLEVIGIEAETWLTPRDFAPDELRITSAVGRSLLRKQTVSVNQHRSGTPP